MQQRTKSSKPCSDATVCELRCSTMCPGVHGGLRGDKGRIVRCFGRHSNCRGFIHPLKMRGSGLTTFAQVRMTGVSG